MTKNMTSEELSYLSSSIAPAQEKVCMVEKVIASLYLLLLLLQASYISTAVNYNLQNLCTIIAHWGQSKKIAIHRLRNVLNKFLYG
jgi:hypothetical protein